MTEKQRRILRKQVRLIADSLGLRDWTINLNYEPDENPNALASVSCTYGRRIATVTFCSDWWERDLHERHHVLIHEMLHVVTDPVRTYLDETLPTLIGQPAWTAIREAVRQHEEHAVDQLASALAPYVPVMEEA